MTRRVLAGDAPAVEAFVERMRCIPRFLALQNSRNGGALSTAELEDLAQDIFVDVWRRLEDFRGESALTTWVWRFCTLQMIARRRRQGALSQLELELDGQDPEQSPARDTRDDEILWEAVAALPDEERLVVTGKHFDALSFSALADRLGVSSNTLKGRYYRGIAKLKASLARKFGVANDIDGKESAQR